jgi:hypothetical protein
MRVILFTREWTSSAVGSTSSCTVLLVSEVSGLQRKVCPRWRPAAWGEPSRPSFPPEGETGKGAFQFLAAAG